jgi:peroxiredoxin
MLAACLAGRQTSGLSHWVWTSIPPLYGFATWVLYRVTPVKTDPIGASLGLPLGAEAPEFELPSIDGPPVSLRRLRSGGRPILLLFVDPVCALCTTLLPEIATQLRENPDKLELTILSRGTPEDNLAKFGNRAVAPLLLQQDAEVAEAYDCPGGPAAVLIGPDGRIATPLAMGPLPVERLVCSLLHQVRLVP